MTTIKEIYCHEFKSKEAAIDWINNNQQSSVVIPFQGLFIDGNPNILPLDYFFTDQINDNHQQYQLHSTINEILESWAPKRLAKKSLVAITQDIIGQINLRSVSQYPYPWLERAVDEINDSEPIKNYKETMQMIINDASDWINYHYKRLILFGMDIDKLAITRQLLNSISIQVHWVYPSDRAYETLLNFNEIEDQIMSNVQEINVTQVDHHIHCFESIEEECYQVLQESSHAKNKVAIIAPNEQYNRQLDIESKRLGIELYFSRRIKLDETMIGAMIKQIIDWRLNNRLESLLEVVLNRFFDQWTGINLVRHSLRTFINQQLFYKQSIAQIENELQGNDIDPSLLKLMTLKNHSDLQEWLANISPTFDITDSGYLNFQASQFIEAAIHESTQYPDPFSYILFTLTKTWLDRPEIVDPKIICITPEDLCRFPNHDFFVLGTSQECWYTKKNDQSYLSIDTLGNTNDQSMSRFYLLNWLINSTQLLSVSFSKKISQKPAHLVEGIISKIIYVNGVKKESDNYQRQLGDFQLANPDQLSPSSIELYQKCPYAFFLKNNVKVRSNTPLTSQQLFGIILHKIIEKIAANELKNSEDVQHYLNQRLTPLQAAVFYKKITGNDWDLVEIFRFFKGHQMISVEETIDMTLNSIKITGRPDVVIKNNDSLEIMDIKTGQPPSLLDIKRFHYIQLGVYGLMLENKQTVSDISCSIFAKNNSYKRMVSNEETKTSIDWQYYRLEINNHLLKVLSAITDKKYQPDQYIGLKSYHLNQCRVCEYYAICPSKERHQR